MPEHLHLERTFGVSGWREWRLDAGAQLLAALGHCLRYPAAAFTLRGVWRMVALWRDRFASIEPAALRLALCVPRALALAEVNVSVSVTLPTGGKPASRLFRLELQKQSVRGAGLPPAPTGCGWSVLQLAPHAAGEFEAMVAALRAAPKGTRLGIEIAADSRRVSDRLRAAFPLRADGRFGSADDWVPLIRSQRLDLRLMQGDGR